jgi:DNA helicase II / ATP-dependent DNA helicase PcrA
MTSSTAGISLAYERVLSLLNDESRVSTQQRAVVTADRDFFALACPGSGKTRVTGLRLAWASVDGSLRRLSATSYTNIAVAEIRRSAEEAGVPPSGEHYVGTLHSFLLRYVVYPFGHLEMGCSTLPRVVMEGRQSAVTIDEVRVMAGAAGIPVWNFHFRADGSFAVDVPQTLTLTPEEATTRGQEQARALKRELFARGLLSPSDAMYVAMKVLERDPDLTTAVARRFAEIVVDEVQDTTDVQFRCLDLIREAGLLSIGLVGDLDQAIYGWMGATPDACRSFAARHGLAEIALTKNFRSSQRICDVTANFSSRPEPDRAAGPYRDYPAAPEVFLYRRNRPRETVEFFARRLEDLGLEPASSAVLVRTGAFADRINGGAPARTSYSVRAIGEAAATFDATGTLDRQTIQNLEGVLAELAWGEAGLRTRSPEERLALRHQAVSLLTHLPELSGNLRDWIAGARTATAAVLPTLTSSPVIQPGNRVRSRSGDEAVDASTAFRGQQNLPLLARTAHSAKGESHAAVLLVAQPPAASRDQARDLIAHLLGGARTEETRVAYVALTRAERYVAIALPAQTPDEVVEAYVAAGFTLIDESSTGIDLQ